MSEAATEAVLRRDRAVVVAALAALTALAWAYLWWLADDMEMGGMDMSGFRMIPAGMGLMVPSAAPMIMIYARVGRQAAQEGKPLAASAYFAAGYLLAWIGFALLATSAQWALDRIGFLTPTMAGANDIFGGAVLIAAGLYQWSPLKDACLRQCQAPLQFIQRHGGFRRDAKGSLKLGIRHGAYCVGCCWALMAL